MKKIWPIPKDILIPCFLSNEVLVLGNYLGPEPINCKKMDLMYKTISKLHSSEVFFYILRTHQRGYQPLNIVCLIVDHWLSNAHKLNHVYYQFYLAKVDFSPFPCILQTREETSYKWFFKTKTESIQILDRCRWRNI